MTNQGQALGEEEDQREVRLNELTQAEKNVVLSFKDEANLYTNMAN